jgi:tetraacyldisaccharide 4'-kinase
MVNMALTAKSVISLATDESIEIALFRSRYPKVHAVAGIGNPERFFKMLMSFGFDIEPHPFSDHHALSESDLNFENDLPVLMTEKDAVKCGLFSNRVQERLFYWPVDAEFETPLSTIISPWLIEDAMSSRNNE